MKIGQYKAPYEATTQPSWKDSGNLSDIDVAHTVQGYQSKVMRERRTGGKHQGRWNTGLYKYLY